MVVPLLWTRRSPLKCLLGSAYGVVAKVLSAACYLTVADIKLTRAQIAMAQGGYNDFRPN